MISIYSGLDVCICKIVSHGGFLFCVWIEARACESSKVHCTHLQSLAYSCGSYCVHLQPFWDKCYSFHDYSCFKNYSGSFPPVFATRRNFEKILSVSHLASLVEPEPFKGKWVLQLPVSLLGVQGKPRNYTALKTKFKKQKCFLLFKQIRSWRFARKWSIKRERIKRLCKLKWHKGAPLKKRHFVI